MSKSSFRNLVVWQKSMVFVLWVYRTTANLPYYERFGLASQLQRAAVSIPSNIAEGSQRRSVKEFRHFCSFAHGSAAEVETQLLLIERLYPRIDVSIGLTQIIELQKMLTALASPKN